MFGKKSEDGNDLKDTLKNSVFCTFPHVTKVPKLESKHVNSILAQIQIFDEPSFILSDAKITKVYIQVAFHCWICKFSHRSALKAFKLQLYLLLSKYCDFMVTQNAFVQ